MEKHQPPSAASAGKRRVTAVFAITTGYMVAEVAGGLLTGSLALLADAGHMLTDVAGLALALLGIRFAERPATPDRTYGYYRVEIMAALANAVLLIGVSAYVLYEAYRRFQAPSDVAAGPMLAVAVVGLLVNVAGVLLLHGGSRESLNLKGAYFEVLSDLLASIGVIIAAAVMWLTGWYYADALVSAAIGLFILPRTWALLREAVGILLEGTPRGLDLVQVRNAVARLDGIVAVHDLHVWTLTSGVNAMSVHVVLRDISRADAARRAIQSAVERPFSIAHLTVQTECESCPNQETHP